MKDLLQWLLSHWELAVSVLLFVLSFILQLLKKKPVVDVFNYVYKLLPDAICEAEKTNLKGDDKLYYALRILIDKLSVYDLKLTSKDYNQVLLAIENILKTPQKHDNK